jgi:esterase/lipase superfamily enzyme
MLANNRSYRPARIDARMKWPCRLVIMSLAAILCACARQPAAFLQPVAPAANSDAVSLLAATSRSPSDDQGVMFTGERGGAISFSAITVSIPKQREIGSVQWPRTSPADPSRDFAVSSAQPMAREGLRKWFLDHRGQSRRVFVYVHGYNTPFGQAVFRFAQLMHDSQADVAPVLFSWPSRGRLLDYKRDLDNATYSRSDLADLLRLAADSPAVADIVIFAHSMGSWVAVEAVRQLALERSGAPPKISNLILASPDLDVGVFRRQVLDMGARRPRLTLFISQEDRALRLSRLVAQGGTRLGAIDPSAEDYRAQLKELREVTVIDLSALRQGDRINHSLYAASPEAVRLIGSRLVAGQPLEESSDRGSFNVVETLGSAARLVVATPVMLLDTATERQ